MFVGRIIVDDGVDHFSHRDLLLDRIEEADELLVAMVLHVAADDGAIEDVESCEQRGGAVTFVVVVIVPARPGFIGNPGWVRSSAWNLALLVDRENNRMGGGGST